MRNDIHHIQGWYWFHSAETQDVELEDIDTHRMMINTINLQMLDVKFVQTRMIIGSTRTSMIKGPNHQKVGSNCIEWEDRFSV